MFTRDHVLYIKLGTHAIKLIKYETPVRNMKNKENQSYVLHEISDTEGLTMFGAGETCLVPMDRGPWILSNFLDTVVRPTERFSGIASDDSRRPTSSIFLPSNQDGMTVNHLQMKFFAFYLALIY